MRTKIPAVYRIVSKVTGWFYIGGSSNYLRRWTVHKHCLKKGRHCCKNMQRDYDDHGINSFDFEVLEYVDVANLAAREQHWLDVTSGDVNRYNTCQIVGSPKGVRFSDEHKAKISAALTGRVRTEAELANLRAGAKKRPPVTQATRALQSASRTGSTRSAETKQKISEAATKRHAERRALLAGAPK